MIERPDHVCHPPECCYPLPHNDTDRRPCRVVPFTCECGRRWKPTEPKRQGWEPDD